MKVKEVMVNDVKACRPETNLAAAAQLMWVNDCGALPVLDEKDQVLGMITDRDICLAVGSRNRPASDISVFEVKPNPKELFTCSPDDDIHAALKTMRERGVRRLPVVNAGKLRGILCLNEITLKASERGALSYEAVVQTLQAISEHRLARRTVAV